MLDPTTLVAGSARVTDTVLWADKIEADLTARGTPVSHVTIR